MKIHGNVEMQENELQNIALKLDTDFPATTKPGMVVFKDKQVYVAAEIVEGSAVWVPLSQKIDYYAHVEASAASTWTIAHNLNTTDITVTVYDSATESVVIPNSITATDANNVTVTFGSAIAGRAVVMFGLFDNPSAASGTEKLLISSNTTNGDTTFTDLSGNVTLTGIGGITHSTAQERFGTSSIFFDNVNNALTIPSGGEVLNFGTGDFTVDTWVYIIDDASQGGRTQRIFMLDSNANNGPNNFQMLVSTAQQVWATFGLGFNTRMETGTLALNTWHHIAVTRSGTSCTLWVNGTVADTLTYSGDLNIGSGFPTIGRYDASSGHLDGYIDSLRVEPGYVRYTAPFTPGEFILGS